MSTQGRADQCMAYIEVTLSTPAGLRAMGVGYSDEAHALFQAGNTNFTPDMIEWQVVPRNSGEVEVSGNLEVVRAVEGLLFAKSIYFVRLANDVLCIPPQ